MYLVEQKIRKQTQEYCTNIINTAYRKQKAI